MNTPINTMYEITEPVTLIYPNLLKPRAYQKPGQPAGEPKYSAKFIFEPSSADLKAIKGIIGGLARANWPDRKFFLTTTDGVKIPNIGLPYEDNDKLADALKKKDKSDEHVRGKTILTAKSKDQPVLFYLKGGKKTRVDTITNPEIVKNKFYSGVKVSAILNFATYPAGGSTGIPGVHVYLQAVLSTGEGPRLAGGMSETDMFSGYAGTVSTTDPTAPGVDQNIDDLL